MDVFSGIYRYWTLSALILLVPLAAVPLMPRGPYRETLSRILLLLLLPAAALLVFRLLAPQLLPDTETLGRWVFWLLLAGLLLTPLLLVLVLPKSPVRTLLVNGLLWLGGAVALVLAVIGTLLPVMPTVPFILLTAACWGRASPRFHAWLRAHRYFGPMVTNWEDRRAIPRHGKYLAWTMMSLSSIGLLVKFPERWYVGAGVGLVCLCVGLWMARLPDA